MWRASSPRSPSLSGAGEGFPGLQVGPVSVSAGCDPTYSIAYWWPVLGHEQRSAIWKQIYVRKAMQQQYFPAAFRGPLGWVGATWPACGCT